MASRRRRRPPPKKNDLSADQVVVYVVVAALLVFGYVALPRQTGEPLFHLSLGGWAVEAALGAVIVAGVAGRSGVLAWAWRRWRPRPTPAAPSRPVAYSREPIPAGLRFAVLNRDGFRCAYCGRGKNEGVQLHIDHLVPVARGGKNELDNLVTACASCNLGKSAQDLVGPDATPGAP